MNWCERELHNDDIFNTGECAMCGGKESQDLTTLINWTEVSRKLSGNDNSIRCNKCPKKYEKKVNRLLKLVELWIKWI
jgi:transcription elongation factor Elf1